MSFPLFSSSSSSSSQSSTFSSSIPSAVPTSLRSSHLSSPSPSSIITLFSHEKKKPYETKHHEDDDDDDGDKKCSFPSKNSQFVSSAHPTIVSSNVLFPNRLCTFLPLYDPYRYSYTLPMIFAFMDLSSLMIIERVNKFLYYMANHDNSANSQSSSMSPNASPWSGCEISILISTLKCEENSPRHNDPSAPSLFFYSHNDLDYNSDSDDPDPLYVNNEYYRRVHYFKEYHEQHINPKFIRRFPTPRKGKREFLNDSQYHLAFYHLQSETQLGYKWIKRVGKVRLCLNFNNGKSYTNDEECDLLSLLYKESLVLSLLKVLSPNCHSLSLYMNYYIYFGHILTVTILSSILSSLPKMSTLSLYDESHFRGDRTFSFRTVSNTSNDRDQISHIIKTMAEKRMMMMGKIRYHPIRYLNFLLKENIQAYFPSDMTHWSEEQREQIVTLSLNMKGAEFDTKKKSSPSPSPSPSASSSSPVPAISDSYPLKLLFPLLPSLLTLSLSITVAGHLYTPICRYHQSLAFSLPICFPALQSLHISHLAPYCHFSIFANILDTLPSLTHLHSDAENHGNDWENILSDIEHFFAALKSPQFPKISYFHIMDKDINILPVESFCAGGLQPKEQFLSYRQRWRRAFPNIHHVELMSGKTVPPQRGGRTQTKATGIEDSCWLGMEDRGTIPPLHDVFQHLITLTLAIFTTYDITLLSASLPHLVHLLSFSLIGKLFPPVQPAEEWMAIGQSVAHCPSITSLSFTSIILTMEHQRPFYHSLSSLTKLSSLSIQDSRVTIEGLESLAESFSQLKKFQSLHVRQIDPNRSFSLTPSSSPYFPFTSLILPLQLSLQSLHIHRHENEWKVDEMRELFSTLSSFPHLSSLSLVNCPAKCLASLGEFLCHHHSLRHIEIRCGGIVRDFSYEWTPIRLGVESFMEHFLSLESLKIHLIFDPTPFDCVCATLSELSAWNKKIRGKYFYLNQMMAKEKGSSGKYDVVFINSAA